MHRRWLLARVRITGGGYYLGQELQEVISPGKNYRRRLLARVRITGGGYYPGLELLEEVIT